jgi:hypothetical protein
MQKCKVRNVIWIKYRGLDVKWLLKIGSYSKPKTELQFLWSSGGSLQKRQDFLGNFDLFLYIKTVYLVYGPWTIAWLGPWWTNHHGQPQCSQELDHQSLWSLGRCSVGTRRQRGF